MLNCLGAKTVAYKRNQIILNEGSPAEYIGTLLSGSAQIIRVDYYGNRNIIAMIEPAQLFGEAFACSGVKSLPIDVVATEDCVVLMINRNRIISPCSNACPFHSRMIFNLLKAVCSKNIMFHQKIEIISKHTTREKLMTYLLLQAKQYNSNAFKIPFDRQELADYLGVERSGLSAEISKLRREGIIACQRSFFELKE